MTTATDAHVLLYIAGHLSANVKIINAMDIRLLYYAYKRGVTGSSADKRRTPQGKPTDVAGCHRVRSSRERPKWTRPTLISRPGGSKVRLSIQNPGIAPAKKTKGAPTISPNTKSQLSPGPRTVTYAEKAVEEQSRKTPMTPAHDALIPIFPCDPVLSCT